VLTVDDAHKTNGQRHAQIMRWYAEKKSVLLIGYEMFRRLITVVSCWHFLLKIGICEFSNFARAGHQEEEGQGGAQRRRGRLAAGGHVVGG